MNFAPLLRGVRLMATYTASVKKVPDNATNDTDRETVVSNVRITPPTEYTRKDEERAGLSTVAADHVCYTIYTNEQANIYPDMILSVEGQEFKIKKVNKLPTVDPVSLLLFLED